MPETDTTTSQALQDTAISWYVRARNPQLSRQERHAFLQWLSADARHRAAFADVEKLWGELEIPARQLGAGGWYRRRPGTHRARWPAALAACLALVILAGIGWHNPGLIQRWQAHYATLPGQPQQIQLDDGSTVWLDGDSALSFVQNDTARYAVLLRGRAWFDVARNENKPFITRQGNLDVRVLGTSFTLDGHSATRTVAVESGQVQVFWKKRALTPQALTRGQRLRFRPGQPPELTEQDVATLSAWRHGLFVFDHASLKDVATTMESALGRRLILAPGLGQQEITGVFQSADPAAMVEGLASSSGLHLHNIPGVGLYLSR